MMIVATGATSFVGCGAVKELLHRGHEVCAVLRKDSKKADLLKEGGAYPERLTIVEADLGELDVLTGLPAKPFDVFLHMGWRGAGSDARKQEQIQQQSVEDALHAVSVAKQLGCKRFLFTGSQAEYGVHDSLMGEETECHPTSPYGKAKLAVREQAEALCRKLSMDYGHVRIFSTYGAGDHPWSLISSCVETFLAGGQMQLSACTQKWNFLYIEDAGRALADLCEYQGRLLDAGCVYNLGGPMQETAPLRNFVETLYALCGKQGSFFYGVRPPNAEGVVNLIPDIRKMERVLGWKPEISFEEGIRRLLGQRTPPASVSGWEHGKKGNGMAE